MDIQDTLFSQTKRGFQCLEREGIQIHFVAGNHWVVSSSIGHQVTLFDSNYKGQLDPSLTEQLAVFYKSLADAVDEEGDELYPPMIVVHTPHIQQQTGSNDCGLFAIAFALHTALGHDLETVLFTQSEMRSHLIKCFHRKYLEPFPHKKVKSIPKEYLGDFHFFCTQLELFCYCMMPETFDDMVECEECEAWYHLKCVHLKEPPAKDDHWLCVDCSKRY